jgi:hypothetical protein
MQSPKRRVLKEKQGNILDKDKTMDNVHKRNIFTNLSSSQTFRSLPRALICETIMASL